MAGFSWPRPMLATCILWPGSGCFCVCFFPPNSFCYRGSYFKSKGDRGISRLVAGGGCHRWCLITDVPGRCWAGCR